jgi:hypothetical protein
MRNLGLMDPAFLGGLTSYDPDAAAYIAAVEAADGQALETGVKDAINAFVLGCKADGIWNAIKASCILAGARTLAGALVPLVGAAPTNFNFVAGDYNRKTGLVGNGTSKFLDSNRSNATDPQNSRHMSVYTSSLPTLNSLFISTTSVNTNGDSYIYIGAGGIPSTFNTVSTVKLSSTGTPDNIGGNSTTLRYAIGLIGANRSASSVAVLRRAGSTVNTTESNSTTPLSQNLQIYGISSFYSNARLAFYSIGESLDLALLDARVTALVNALAVAIP